MRPDDNSLGNDFAICIRLTDLQFEKAKELMRVMPEQGNPENAVEFIDFLESIVCAFLQQPVSYLGVSNFTSWLTVNIDIQRWCK